jgi:hypothetical protein
VHRELLVFTDHTSHVVYKYINGVYTAATKHKNIAMAVFTQNTDNSNKFRNIIVSNFLKTLQHRTKMNKNIRQAVGIQSAARQTELCGVRLHF